MPSDAAYHIESFDTSNVFTNFVTVCLKINYNKVLGKFS